MDLENRMTLSLVVVMWLGVSMDGHAQQPPVSSAPLALNPTWVASETLAFLPSQDALLEGTLKNTQTIGTREHPTIEGGIIHSPDLFLKQTASASFQSVPSASSVSAPLSFADDWATATQVKTMLTQAAQQGKLAYVLKKSEALGLPASVALLPVIESGYQVDAVSPKGAAGAWQLMPSVAKDYGLDNPQRFEFKPATDTALHLLSDLHRRFGNWVLAFAAYHAGSARLAEALRKAPEARTLSALDLPMETKRYVQKMHRLNNTLMALSHDTP